MIDTLSSLLERLQSDAYDPIAVAVELLLIALAINWCAGVLHGTRGTRLLRGLLLVLVIATLIVRVLAAQLGWTRLELLYRYVVFGLAVVGLVAFQPELRRFFIRLGEVGMLRRGSPQARLVAALVESAGFLSRRKHGALVAIQRGVGLRNWAENGTLIDAEMSASLLNSIFFANAPLHDLGVIIQENRVLAAACQFPQAESEGLDPLLGSRHRAALGMSYESDALVLVVSEETGRISLADSGHLVRMASLDELRSELTKRLGAAPPRRVQRAWRVGDVWRIVRRVAVVVPLTLVIWYLADQASQAQTDGIKLRLDVRSDAAVQVDLIDPAPPIFSVSFRGPTRAIDTIRALAAGGPVVAPWTLPAEESTPGTYSPSSARVLGALTWIRSKGVTVEKVFPDRFSYRVEPVVRVAMPVRADAGAVRLADARCEPATVQVTLRARDLESLPEEQRFVTARLDPRDAKLSAEPLDQPRVPLLTRIGGVDALRLEPPEANVTARVVGQTVRRPLAGVAVRLLANPQLWQRYDIELADPNEWLIDVEIEGDKTIVDGVRAQDLLAYVVVRGEQAGPSTGVRSETVMLSLPPGIKAVGPPRVVQFRVVERVSTPS